MKKIDFTFGNLPPMIADPNVIEPDLATLSATFNADPVEMATMLAEKSTSEILQKTEMVAKATGLQSQLEKYGIKINTDQAMKILAAVGAASLWKMSKEYRKQILIGLAVYLAYMNQDKILGEKMI